MYVAVCGVSLYVLFSIDLRFISEFFVFFFFFFQAEDGIRDDLVTGVQTCALPIYIAPATGARKRNETQQVTAARLQVLRRADRLPDRAWPDRRGRPERLRQVQSGRGAALGYGRDLAPVGARGRYGRRDRPRRHP